jgi:hypothetical protein
MTVSSDSPPVPTMNSRMPRRGSGLPVGSIGANREYTWSWPLSWPSALSDVVGSAVELIVG